ncbi:MAG: phosphoketolase family protein [Patescibacteria group bacterium]
MRKFFSKKYRWFEEYFRYVNYIAAAMLYLQDNFLLREPLKPEHIKPRPLGHWGTVPGLSFIYMHLNYLIHKEKADVLLVVGPGHGAPAILANLFAEKSLQKYYPKLKLDIKGTGALLKSFSWPGGFPSHLFPGVPGSILEGGELGYSLSTAYGAAFDNPNLIVACVVGDGEAETGPLAAAWHSNKFLDPATCGAVLPILHINGYKISNPTIFGTMSDHEIELYFRGLGYETFIIGGGNMHGKMEKTLSTCYRKIRAIQKTARSTKPGGKNIPPRWPMIVLRTKKGWTGLKTFLGKEIEGTWRSHGMPLKNPKTNYKELRALEEWLGYYKIGKLVDDRGRPLSRVLRYIPEGNLRMGLNRHALGGNVYKPLKLPGLRKFEVKKDLRGKCNRSSTQIIGEYMGDIFKLNAKAKNFRLMCPDEIESNKIDAIFKATDRAYVWPLNAHDMHFSRSGRAMEILSEHTLQGWLQGYLLTGRHGLFSTYEAFATIVASMVDQYAKFLKQSRRFPWRKEIASLNYLLTSVGWRQDHNGYSHQNPSFISNVLEKHGQFCSVYFPADVNSFLAIMEDCFRRKNSINVIAAGKQELPQWVTLEEAREQVRVGVGVWDWINPAHAKNPDVVLAAAGDHMTEECMAAIDIMHELMPAFKIRFVNVSELTALGMGDERRPCLMCTGDFYKYFGRNVPIVFSFHGYPDVIKKLTWGHPDSSRFSIHGYLEEGTTTTPFNMQVLNKTSRYHLCMDMIGRVAHKNKKVAAEKNRLMKYLQGKLDQHADYIVKNGHDMMEIEQWQWGGNRK